MSARHQFQRHGSRFSAHHRGYEVLGIPAVLVAVCGVNLIVCVTVSVGKVNEDDVLLYAAGIDVAFMPYLGASEPGGVAPISGPDVKVVANPHDPYRDRFSQGALLPERGDLQF